MYRNNSHSCVLLTHKLICLKQKYTKCYPKVSDIWIMLTNAICSSEIYTLWTNMPGFKYVWLKHLKNGQISVDEDERSGWPSIGIRSLKVITVQSAITGDHHSCLHEQCNKSMLAWTINDICNIILYHCTAHDNKFCQKNWTHKGIAAKSVL